MMSKDDRDREGSIFEPKEVTGLDHRPRSAFQGNGRHEETRTPDLYRVKVAL